MKHSVAGTAALSTEFAPETLRKQSNHRGRAVRAAQQCRRACMALTLTILSTLAPAQADDSIDPSLIPDGTYPAHVEKVINAQHIAVTMQGVLKVFLASGRPSVTFADKLKSNDDIIVTLTDGKVVEFAKK